MRSKIKVPAQIVISITKAGNERSLEYNNKLMFYLDDGIIFFDDDAVADIQNYYRQRVDLIAYALNSELDSHHLSQFLDLFSASEDEINEIDQFFDMVEEILPYAYERDNAPTFRM